MIKTIENQSIETISFKDPRIVSLTSNLGSLFFSVIEKKDSYRTYDYDGFKVHEIDLPKVIPDFKFTLRVSTQLNCDDEEIKNITYVRTDRYNPPEIIIIMFNPEGVAVSSLGNSEPGEVLKPFVRQDSETAVDTISRLDSLVSGYLVDV